jgi:acyl-CoA reductase-like NAD-dependent aldehyde dehydrogenase
VALFESVLAPCPVFGAYGGRELGEAVTHLPVSLIAFTGSSATGRKIAQVAAAGLKRCVLELGGLDGAIVLKDADIAASAKEIVFRNSANSGQVCAAVKRVFVERALYPQFVRALQEEQAKLVLGDPLSPETDLGPLVSAPQLSRVESFVADAVQKGARVVRGGKRVGERGYFYEPTLLVDVPEGANLLREEPFGPVLPVLPIDSLAEGIAQVNSSPYGLMASLFTADTARAAEIASELDVGTVCINCHLAGGPGTPFGGVKESGYGRVRTEEGLHEYTNVKLIRHLSSH